MFWRCYSLFSTTITDPSGYNTCDISSFGLSDWLVKDRNSCPLFHITEENILRATTDYDFERSYNAIRLGADYLVTMAYTSINLHKLEFVVPEDLTPSAVLRKIGFF